jgi:hypothetical protein
MSRRSTPSRRTIFRCVTGLALLAGVHVALADDEISALADDETSALELPTDEPFDFSVPLPAPPPSFGVPARDVDQSKYLPKPPKNHWSAKAGIDDRLVTPNAALRPDPFVSNGTEQTNGVAWANITGGDLMVLDNATIETRLDPQQQGKLGMNLSRSVSLGESLSMTWQQGYALTHALPSGVPATPVTAPPVQGATSIDSHQTLRFTILPADTTVSLGAALSNTSEKWLRSMSAEQKLFGGPVSITGTIAETATGNASKSVKAGIKKTW